MYKVNKINKEKRRASVMKRIINIIVYIVIIPIIIFNFTLITKSFFNSDQTPDFFGYKNYIIVSGSMQPTIMKGDVILVKKVEQEEIKINDIISFRDDENITTHRVIEIIEENGVKKYKTKGDHNNFEDKEKVRYDEIEGKYQLKINGFGNIIEILKNKITLLILVILLGLNFWYSRRINKKKKIRKEKRKQHNLLRKQKNLEK